MPIHIGTLASQRGRTSVILATSGGNQVTTYLYEDPVDATHNTSQIYPDSTDTTSSRTNQIKLAYTVGGSLSQRIDQRGVVLSYAYTNRYRSWTNGLAR
jgi:hypothetical protein